MALDAGMIAALTHELEGKLAGAKLEKLHQPERDEIDLYLRAGGKPVGLALCAAPGSPRLCLFENKRENPAVPPMFCTLLRKHLAGGVLRGIRQLGFERAVEFSFAARDEMGFETRRILIFEMMGKYSNLIFTDESRKILGVLRPVDFSTSEKRQLLCGMVYEEPPLQEGKEDPTTESAEHFLIKALEAKDRPADKFIVASYRGIAPLVAREIAYEASGCTDCPSGVFANRLWKSFEEVMRRLREKDFAPCIVQAEGKNLEYSFLPLRQYGAKATVLYFESPSELVETFYAEKERSERVHRRAQDLYRLLNNAESRLLRKMEVQRGELADCADKEKYKLWGELIKSNLYALKKGQDQVRLINYYSEDMEEVTLTLDSRLSPAANVQRCFKLYDKAKTAERELAVQLQKAEEELTYVRSVTDALERASLPADIEGIRKELVSTGYLSYKKGPSLGGRPGAQKYFEYRTSGGFRVLCGRNNLQNDELTFKVAEKNDWWFHVHGAPGSHTLLLCEGVDDPPAEDFTQAAMIAAVNSGLLESPQVTVDYTKVRNIKKPPHAKPGFVIYHTNYSAVVAPDAAAVKTLQK